MPPAPSRWKLRLLHLLHTPVLPLHHFSSASLPFIYGHSQHTQIKLCWDFWLKQKEFKPLQTFNLTYEILGQTQHWGLIGTPGVPVIRGKSFIKNKLKNLKNSSATLVLVFPQSNPSQERRDPATVHLINCPFWQVALVYHSTVVRAMTRRQDNVVGRKFHPEQAQYRVKALWGFPSARDKCCMETHQCIFI